MRINDWFCFGRTTEAAEGRSSSLCRCPNWRPSSIVLFSCGCQIYTGWPNTSWTYILLRCISLKRGEKLFFIVKFFPYPRNLRFGRDTVKNSIFGVPIFDSLYLSSGTSPMSKNQITGVFLSKFFATCHKNIKNGNFRAKRNIRRFRFFKEISPKTQNFGKSWNFYYKK